MSDPNVPDWSKSPGSMVPAEQVDWEKPVQFWGPPNPLRPKSAIQKTRLLPTSLALMGTSVIAALISYFIILSNIDALGLTNSATIEDLNAQATSLAENGTLVAASLIFLISILAFGVSIILTIVALTLRSKRKKALRLEQAATGVLPGASVEEVIQGDIAFNAPPQHFPKKTWGRIHVFFAFLFIILAAAVPAFIAIFLVLGATTSADPNAVNDEVLSLATNGPFLVTSLVLLWAVFWGYPAWITRYRGSRSFKKDFWLSFNWKFDIVAGLALAAGLRIAEAGLMFLISATGIDLSSADNSSFLNDPTRPVIWTILLALGAGLGAPIFEEIFFRGFVLQALMRGKTPPERTDKQSRRGTMIMAIIVSSALFGVLHTTAFNTGGLVVVTITGLLGASFAVITLLLGRLGTAIIGHAVFNTSAVILVLFSALQATALPYAVFAAMLIIFGGIAWRMLATNKQACITEH